MVKLKLFVMMDSAFLMLKLHAKNFIITQRLLNLKLIKYVIIKNSG